ncbi:hypothetical protein OESDEN_13933 [Oesophagostomum dentatum]|uniref:ubiquitinyl hydrolase 1 n=1 Tax=Oesophagostomum dentatum TaxID=61180 RepID=A0A0B1SQZ7_OESDE|nr:hypothetical protein OESDEN_13933 [Oesophagostomum dentatum]
MSFQGTSLQRIWCTCGKESRRSSPFTALQLNIDGYKTLQEALDAYCGEEINGRNRKLKTPIVYPRELTARSFHLGVSKYDDFDYELFAVMIHEGDNTFCGHYYDLVRHPFTGVWYKYNDEHVEPLARPPGVERSRSAPGARPTPDMKACYGLAYRRKELAVPPINLPPDEITGNWAAMKSQPRLGWPYCCKSYNSVLVGIYEPYIGECVGY